jgi:hypothetical protein
MGSTVGPNRLVEKGLEGAVGVAAEIAILVVAVLGDVIVEQLDLVKEDLAELGSVQPQHLERCSGRRKARPPVCRVNGGHQVPFGRKRKTKKQNQPTNQPTPTPTQERGVVSKPA